MNKKHIVHLPKGEFFMLEHDVFPLEAYLNCLYGYEDYGSYWLDIGTHRRYNLANKDVECGYFTL